MLLLIYIVCVGVCMRACVCVCVRMCMCTDMNACSFRCGIEYHAPTDCDVIKKWLTKCADDSETANYISAHTKDVSCNAVLGVGV